ncbi:MAG: DUF222 domain-containing protein [Acidimicrobiales bacterium]
MAVIEARHRLIAFEQAEQAADVAELAHCPPGGPDTPADRGGLDTLETTVDELRLALTLTRHAAGVLLDTSLMLDSRLPEVAELLRSGRIDWVRARVMVDTTRELDTDTARTVVSRVLDRAPALTTSELRTWLARAVIKADPESAEKRRREGLEDRGVEAHPNPDGTGNLNATSLPGERVAAIMNHLTALARNQPRQDNDTRGIDQRRADAFLQLLDPEPTDTAEPAGPPTRQARPADRPTTTQPANATVAVAAVIGSVARPASTDSSAITPMSSAGTPARSRTSTKPPPPMTEPAPLVPGQAPTTLMVPVPVPPLPGPCLTRGRPVRATPGGGAPSTSGSTSAP